MKSSGLDSKNNFIYVNCAELRKEEQFDYLFGNRDFRGSFRSAHQGTKFLNRVDLLSQEAQTRILRIIQDHTIYTTIDYKSLPVSFTRFAIPPGTFPTRI